MAAGLGFIVLRSVPCCSPWVRPKCDPTHEQRFAQRAGARRHSLVREKPCASRAAACEWQENELGWDLKKRLQRASVPLPAACSPTSPDSFPLFFLNVFASFCCCFFIVPLSAAPTQLSVSLFLSFSVSGSLSQGLCCSLYIHCLSLFALLHSTSSFFSLSFWFPLPPNAPPSL